MKAIWLAAGALAVLLVGAGAASAGDRDIDRTVAVRLAQRSLHSPQGAQLAGGGLPSGFEPRDFPSVLRDPALEPGPRGVLWQRWQERLPGVDLRRWSLQRLSDLPVGAPLEPLAAAGLRGAPDTVRILALRVDFLHDSAGAASTTEDGRFNLQPRDSSDVLVDPAPHNRTFFDRHFEALRRYYERQSGGQLVLTWDIYPAEEDSAYHLDDTADYGPWVLSYGDNYILELAEKLVRDAFAVADTSDAPPDFRRYQSFLLFHAGADYQGDINGDSDYDIPSFNLQLAEPVAVQDSSCFIDLIMVVPEQVSQDGYTGALNGVLAHEFGHQLGFFDLYDVLTFVPMVGMFSLMDSGEQLFGSVWDSTAQKLVFVRGAIPASIDPWTKLMFFPEGVDAFWVDSADTLTLPAVQLGNRMALVPIGGQGVIEDPAAAPNAASEYFIIENRPYDLNADGSVILEADPQSGVFLGPSNIARETTDSLGVPPDDLGVYESDYLLPGSGLLIWHVDNAAINAAWQTCYGCINIDPARRGVDVEEADGIADLGDVYSVEWTGGRYDYWYRGAYYLFGPDTDPSTRSTAGGVTGISIDVVDSARADGMRFVVQRGLTRDGWPRYVGEPLRAESLNPIDLDGDGGLEILSAAGNYVVALTARGTGYRYAAPGGLFAYSDSLLLPGLAAHDAFAGASGAPRAVVAAASAAQVTAWDERGAVQLAYPGAAGSSAALRFTTPPMLLDSILVVGDAEGRLRGLLPGSAGNELRWRTGPPSFPVTAVAAGDLYGDGGRALVWGNRGGEVRVARGWQRSGFTLATGWPASFGSDPTPIAAVLVVEGPLGEAGTVLAVDEAGRVGIFAADGVLSAGWPQEMGAAPAGPPVVGDPDGDGVLEAALTCVDGRVHLFAQNGIEELGWPHSVWHPDVTPFGPIASGPSLADMDGDARPEVLQGSADGTLHVLTKEGAELEGWPLAAGYTIAAGPQLVATGAQGALELLAADGAGFVKLIMVALPAHAPAPGEMWRADGGPARTHAYPRAMRPVPVAYAGLLDQAWLRFAPNPIVGAQGTLRVRMGAPGRLSMRLYDTSGEPVWDDSYFAADVTEEVVWPLDFGDLAPGLYVAQITAEGEGERVRLMRKVAIVR